MMHTTQHANRYHFLSEQQRVSNSMFTTLKDFGKGSLILFILLIIFGGQKINAQCDTEVSGVLAYCHSFKGNSNNIIPGYFIGFRILSLDGDTLNVVDLAGNVPMNLGKRINDINTQQEPADTSRVPVRIAGGIDSLEFWYFGPFMDGDSFNIVLVDPTGQCDTVFVAAGTFTCQGQDPLACESDVPLYVLDFSESDWQIGGSGGGNENVDDVFLVMSRERKAACCFTNNERCFEFIIKLDEDDNGILIDDVGNGSPGGKIYADSLNGFTCGPTTAITWPYFQDNGNSSDVEPLCLFADAREWIVLTCKPGANITSASIGTVGETNVLPEFLFSECMVTMDVLNADSAIWSSPDDPNLDNLRNFTNRNLSTEFLYDTAVFGPVTACEGDTFRYYVGGFPLANTCFNTDTLIYDTTYVVVYPDFDVVIDTLCYTVDSLRLTANITSPAAGCSYDFNWSTGDTTQTITVPNIPDDYYVTVERSDLENNVVRCDVVTDTIRVEIISFECVGEPALYFDCVAEPPPPDPQIITVGGCFSDPLFYYYDVSNNGLGCPGDSLIITRYYIVDYDRDTTLTAGDRDTCIQLFIYVDDVPPVLLGCPGDITIDCNSSTLMQDTGGPPTATDNCDSMPVITFEEIVSSGSCPQEGFITRIWTATDYCGNSATCSQVISIEDNLLPDLLCPPDTVILCSANSLPSALGIATAVDNCDLMPDVTFSDQLLSSECPVVLLRTWIATDDCGNISTCLQTVEMIDTISPVITCPADITILCDESSLPVITGTAGVSDNCDPDVDVYFDDLEVTGACPQESIITRTWVATDVCGNIDTCIQIITVVDTIAPELSCATDITIECTDSTLPAMTGTSTAIDNCDMMPVVMYTDSAFNGSCPQESFIHRIWSATDACGNIGTCIQVISIEDRTPPVVTCPPDLTLSCTASTNPDSTGIATAIDNCGMITGITYSDIVLPLPSCPQEYRITRTWQATDECGNIGTCEQIIIIDDNIPPVIVCPENITIECTSNTLPGTTGTATAIDNCDTLVTITFTDIVLNGSCPQESVIQRTWRAEDDCGNFNTCLQLISRIDTISPVITCPVDITIACSASTLPANTGTATATDNCDATLAITFTSSFVTGICPQERIITRTWQATDDCGNFSTCIQVISVVDDTPPIINCPANITIACTASTLPANTGTATATDDCGVSLNINFIDEIVDGICPQEMTIIRTWTATDECGNSSMCIQNIAVDDSTPPVIVCPVNITISCTDNTLPPNTGSASATDNCSTIDPITYSDVTLGLPSCPQEYIITRTWMATDACGNVSTCNQIISIDDNTPPVISCPANIIIDCTEDTSSAFTGEAMANDNCDLLVAISSSDIILAGNCPQSDTILRTWLATDDCGNSSTCLQIIIVQDTTKPAIVCAVDTIINCTESTHPDNTGYAESTDNCDVLVLVTHSDEISAGDCLQEIEITRTWLATDDCGNTNSCIQIITVQDTTRPVIVCPSDTLINCTESSAISNTGEATATDNCDAMVAITYLEEIIAGECPQEDTLIRTWLATDDCGNTNSCVQIIIVQDTTKPIIICPRDTIIDCTEITLPSNTGEALSSDNCDADVNITYEDVVTPGSCPQEMTITRTWMAEDDCGNTSICVQLITSQDTVAPTVLCPADVTIVFPASTLPEATGIATGDDNCDTEVLITYLDSIPSEDCPVNNFIFRTWIATDDCNNSSSCIQYILIEDHGSICGKVEDDLGSPVGNVIIHLYADNNSNQQFDAGDTLVTSTMSAMGTGLYCFMDVNPCDYVLVEVQPLTYGELFDYDYTPDPDGNDSLDGPDNEIPVTLAQVESDLDNNFIDIACPTLLPVIPPDTICDGESVVFETIPLNPGPLNYEWNFGSGSTPTSGTGLGPHSVSFITTTNNQAGGAIITLTVSKEGCPDLTGQVSTVDINPYPNPAISGSLSNLCYFTNRTFKPVATEIPGATYTWTFGNNAVPASATGYGPHMVYYTLAGSKTVKLVIEPNEAGAQCPDSSTIVFNVINCPGNITGTVRSDVGVGIPGVNLKLYADVNQDGFADSDTIIRSVNTVLSGAFSMVGLPPGDYVIIETQPSLWFSIDDGDISPDGDNAANIDSLDNLIPATVRPSTVDAGNIFIEAALDGAISGAVFVDINNNQLPDPGEGLADVIIGLYADEDKDGAPDDIDPIDTVWTTSTGSYSFTSVEIGHYVVIETQPADFTSVLDIDASADPDSVDNTNMLDDIIPVTVTNNEHDQSNYFIEENECFLVVFNLDDAGAGSLREAIDCAGSGQTITFSPSLAGDTIRITSARITIDQNIIIESTISPSIVVMSEIEGLFDIANLVNVEMRNFTIISGIDGHEGAAIFNFGNLTLHNMNILRNPSLTPGQYLIKNVNNGQLILSGNCFIMSD